MKPGVFQVTTKLFLLDGTHLLTLRDRDSGTGDLPGGRLEQSEFNEPWEQAVEREVREELGDRILVSIHPESLFVFPHFILKDRVDALGVAFRGTYLGGPLELSEEHDRWKWVNLKSYEPEGFFPPTLAAAIRRFQARFF